MYPDFVISWLCMIYKEDSWSAN